VQETRQEAETAKTDVNQAVCTAYAAFHPYYR
jgi:hypothetical protein